MKKTLKKSIYSISILLLLLSISWLYGEEFYIGELNAGTLTINSNTIVVEIVDTHPARSKGLGGRDYLKEGTGMLFIFPNEDYYGFWMKDMKFPIDIIWMSSDFRITDIKKNVLPETYPEVFGPREVSMYVLEVNAGFVDRYNIKIGDRAQFVDHTLPEVAPAN